jgi:tetratricopeptide (TPR) repeat protein
VILGCLQGDPAARFASASAALAALYRPPPPAASRRPRWIVPAVAVTVVAAAGVATGIAVRRHAGDDARDPRLAEAFAISQRGEHERAAVMLEAYLVDHPADPDALVAKLLSDWWQSGATDTMVGRAVGAKLRPEQRALVHGIDLIAHRREIEAIGYLEQADRETPNAVEIQFTLGEARWHGQKLEDGAATLERAFAMDPRWQMALHHPIEYRLSRGETDRLRPIADKMRTVDPSSAGALDCKIAIGERRYADAEKIAAAAIAAHPPIAESYICLSHARTLQGRLDEAADAAERAFGEWPIDLREWGGFATHAETLLYRGQLDEYLDLVRDKPSRQRTLALAMWRPTPTLSETTPVGSGMRMPPLGAVTWILCGWLQKRDEAAVYTAYPEPEVAAYGKGLWAETRGDNTAAIAHYRDALAVPSKGDVRMLVAHHLARVLTKTGDAAGAKAACDDVISPRFYQPYRAIVLPDCLLWSGDPASWQQLVDNWRGTFAHPAVVEARKRLTP